ncbi:UBA1 [Symbiodinium natans]|uniref:UBA1 protein n=1 Tax=Symbiodinium natans TaxID=878477 RepID=A0A812P831_9DINO|nr:UBA1 [Symbiodinium natans]
MPILEQEGRKGTLKPSLGIKVFIGFSSCGLFARSISGRSLQKPIPDWETRHLGQPLQGLVRLASSVFVDYGESFTCRDKDGEEPRSAIVSGVTLENPGTVHTHQDRRHGFNDGDWVVFREVQGMTQLNDGKPRQIKVTGPYSFSIEDTTGYSAATSDRSSLKTLKLNSGAV